MNLLTRRVSGSPVPCPSAVSKFFLTKIYQSDRMSTVIRTGTSVQFSKNSSGPNNFHYEARVAHVPLRLHNITKTISNDSKQIQTSHFMNRLKKVVVLASYVTRNHMGLSKLCHRAMCRYKQI